MTTRVKISHPVDHGTFVVYTEELVYKLRDGEPKWERLPEQFDVVLLPHDPAIEVNILESRRLVIEEKK